MNDFSFLLIIHRMVRDVIVLTSRPSEGPSVGSAGTIICKSNDCVPGYTLESVHKKAQEGKVKVARTLSFRSRKLTFLFLAFLSSRLTTHFSIKNDTFGAGMRARTLSRCHLDEVMRT